MVIWTRETSKVSAMNVNDGVYGDNVSVEKGGTISSTWRSLTVPPRTRTRVAIKSRVHSWYQQYFVELVLRRKPLPPSKNGRHIPLALGHEKLLIDERRGHPYVSNAIRTSRYTVYDFLPKQVLF